VVNPKLGQLRATGVLRSQYVPHIVRFLRLIGLIERVLPRNGSKRAAELESDVAGSVSLSY
jgi:hypothetical protein